MANSETKDIIKSVENTMEKKQGPMKIYMWLFAIIIVVCLSRSYSNRAQVRQPSIGQYYY